jgi:DNA-binding CsgD family transcriptional regulator/tetratricopeptide (TPR) repeat protein
MMRQVLGWASEHDPAVALQLAVALAPWWLLRGRAASGYPVLREASERAVPGEPAWCEAQQWLGRLTLMSGDLATSLDHFTAVCDAAADRGPSRALALSLGGRSVTLANLGQVAEAVGEARRSLAMAEELGYPDGQAIALMDLAIASDYSGDPEDAIQFARQAGQVPGLSGSITRIGDNILTGLLIDTGNTAAAKDVCVAALARAEAVGDQWNLAVLLPLLATLDLRASRTDDAARHLREALQVVLRTGNRFELGNILAICGQLCAATGRHGEAVTLLTASDALSPARREEFPETAPWVRRKREVLREAWQALGPDAARTAEERGAMMSAATAAEYVLLLTTPAQPADTPEPGAGQLSARERELVILVAQGRTNAQIAAELFISVRTVGSHLDRIRDKTGCRRRTDLTRLALSTGLV